jgi:hypothetical protein
MQIYEMEGPQFLFMEGARSGTCPMAVVKKLTKGITEQGDERALLARSMLDNRRQYLEAFRAQRRSRKWQQLDICPMRAIEQFICHGDIARDDWLPYLGAKPLKPDHVDQWLGNVIALLTLHGDTYHLALLDDRTYPDNPVVKSIWQYFWG